MAELGRTGEGVIRCEDRIYKCHCQHTEPCCKEVARRFTGRGRLGFLSSELLQNCLCPKKKRKKKKKQMIWN